MSRSKARDDVMSWGKFLPQLTHQPLRREMVGAGSQIGSWMLWGGRGGERKFFHDPHIGGAVLGGWVV